MSEFSDSYHLLGDDGKRVKQLLQAAARHGAVLPSRGRRWAAFLVDGVADAGGAVEAVVQHNGGVLLHLAYADDHGLWLRLFEGARAVGDLGVTRRGGDVGDAGQLCEALVRLGGASADEAAELRGLVSRHARDGAGDELPAVCDLVVGLLGLAAARQVSCADLTRDKKGLGTRFPGVEFVLEKRRGAADKAAPCVPNRWCPAPGLPSFMYLPVPEGEVDAALLARHVEHWVTTGDFDEERQAGFWLLTAYQRALPSRHRHLGDRLLQRGLAFPRDEYRVELERTLRGILAVASAGFDWAPYLERRAGEQRL